ncbi:MAG TPA: polyprenyl synthetase family protein [Elusimicrobiales bacterium]|nr:polyprenyl synthetase family protein [Elusimicrobiales bacterium]
MSIEQYLARSAAAVNAALPGRIRALKGAQPSLAEAMLYSLSAGGKRLRPALLGAAYELSGRKAGEILPAACALEMVHTYSLIHDDLPCMDDAALRRGRRTCHKVYGEAAAVLAGDALLTDAFTVLLLSKYPGHVDSARLLRAAGIMARRAGARGMVSGQAADLAAEGFLDSGPGAGSGARRRREGLARLEYIHLHKTADLICAAVEMGAALAGAAEKDFKALSAFGRDLGLCFQVADDILDAAGDDKKLGKARSDAENRKLTYATLLGVDEARRRGAALLRSSLKNLEKAGGPPAARARLAALAGYVYGRDN